MVVENYGKLDLRRDVPPYLRRDSKEHKFFEETLRNKESDQKLIRLLMKIVYIAYHWLVIIILTTAVAMCFWAYNSAPPVKHRMGTVVMGNGHTLSLRDFCAWDFSRPDNTTGAINPACE